MNFLNSLNFKRSTAIGWYLLIIAGSSIPGKKIPHFFTLTPDKLIHCLEYFGLGFLLVRWFTTQFTSFSLRKVAMLALLVGAICGMMDEFYQNLTPNRTPDFYDWCLDVVGIILSIVLFLILQKTRA
jgi:VanZ family protein